MRWLLACCALGAYAQTADLAVTDARVYTSDSAHPLATAFAIKDGKFLAVGSLENISKHIGPATRRFDAKGAMVMPGFIDSHGHMRNLGDSLETLDLRGMKSEAGIAEKVRIAARERKGGEWIRGRAWDQNLWEGKAFPTSKSLTAAAPENPVFLTRVDGHAAWVNQRALDMADINASTKDPPGGKILRLSSGAPSGVLIDRAQGLVGRKIPEATAAEVTSRIARAARECARFGITTVHDAGVAAEDIAAYRALAEKAELPVRVYAMIGGVGPLWSEWLRRGPEIGDFLTVRSIKLVADGALGSRGAALLATYSDDPGNSGLLILDEPAIRQAAEQAVGHGFQVNTHAIGDRANRVTLDAYSAVLKGHNDKRFRVEHAQIVSPPDFRRFRDFDVIASVQATHATSDMPWAETRVGPERIRGAYAWQTFLKLGVRVPNGSDFPVENVNPLLGFYSAVTRQDADGNPPSGWFPDQRMSRKEALHSWTMEGAYAAFEEKTKGSITPGKFADFVVLSRDIMEIPAPQILKTHVTMTVVNGKIVYSE